MTSPFHGFRIVGSRRLAVASFLEVERLHLRAPDGSAVTRVAVRHPGAVAVVPVDGDDVLMIEQYRAPVGRLLLEIPAGKLDVPGEPPEPAARRELEEEIGQRTDALEHLTTIATTPGFSDEVIHIFATDRLHPVPARPVGVEESAARVVRMPMDEAVAKAQRGQITDAKTVIGLLLAAVRR